MWIEPPRPPRGPMASPTLAAMPSGAFPKFSKLPTELRLMIWELALPDGRMYEVLDRPNAKQRTPAADGLMFANQQHEPPPSMAMVNAEARWLVLQRYRPVTLSGTTKYLDLSRDMILLEPYLLVKRLLRTLHFLAQLPDMRKGLKHLAFGTSYGVHAGICHPILSWKVSKHNINKLLARLAEFPKVKRVLFVLHQAFQFDFPIQSSSTACPKRPAVPQMIHQAYRFKFDIESSINSRQFRRPHSNQLLQYPLPVPPGDLESDLDLAMCMAGMPNGDDFDDSDEYTMPTNDDWRRFRRRFYRAVHLTVERTATGELTRIPPALDAASVLWNYESGEKWRAQKPEPQPAQAPQPQYQGPLAMPQEFTPASTPTPLPPLSLAKPSMANDKTFSFEWPCLPGAVSLQFPPSPPKSPSLPPSLSILMA